MSYVKIVVASKTFKIESTPSYRDFVARVSRKLNNANIDNYDISYIDEDKENVSMASQEDYRHALKRMSGCGLKFILRNWVELEASNEDLFRVMTLTRFISKVDDRLDSLRQNADVPNSNEPLLLGNAISFGCPQKVDPAVSALVSRNLPSEQQTAKKQQNSVSEAMLSFFQLYLFSRLKFYVLEQFKDICRNTVSEENRRDVNSTRATLNCLRKESNCMNLMNTSGHQPRQNLNIFQSELNSKAPPSYLSITQGKLTRLRR